MLACATRHVIGWFRKQQQDRPHSMSLSSPHSKALGLIFFLSPWLRGERDGHECGNEGEKRSSWQAREWEREQQTHRGPWQLPITLPRAVERERQRDSALRRPSYTMRLPWHFYITCPVEMTRPVYIIFIRITKVKLLLHKCKRLWCGCSVCQLLTLIYHNDLSHQNFFFPHIRNAKLLTQSKKLTNFDLTFFALCTVLSILNVRWCSITPLRITNSVHTFFKSVYKF